MLSAHHANAFLVIAVCLARASVAAFLARRRGRGAVGRAHLLALAQTLSSRRSLFGLLLLADHRRAADRLHYAYGTFALLAVFAPWLYAPTEPRARLLWFAVATLARRRARRPGLHDRHMSRISPFFARPADPRGDRGGDRRARPGESL